MSMKTLCATLLLLASICLPPALHADLTIVQKVVGMDQDMESTTKIKPGKTRVDASPATSIIMDLKTGEIISLMHAEKKYMKIPGQMAQAAIEGMQKMEGDQPGTAPELKPTGKKETIGGYPTEEYTCNVAGSKLSLWLTRALPDYQAVLTEMATAFKEGPMAAMMKHFGVDFATLPGFPMRTVNELQPGQTITSTVLSVSTKPIPDSDFDIPADYQAMKTPSLTPSAAEEPPAVSK
jgi:hypothetical protein